MYDLSVINIGNTHVSIGYLLKGQIQQLKKRKTKHIKKTFKLLDTEKIIFSSVVPKISEILKKRYPLAEEINSIPSLQFPSNVGIDRIISCYSAIKLYKTKNVLVIDAGTALTFTCCLNNTFKGGLIMPGIGVATTALIKNTSLLKTSSGSTETSLFERETNKAISAGVHNLFIRSINSLLVDYKKQTSTNLTVVLTGGDSLLLNDYLENINIVNPTLLLEGLALLS